MTGRETDRERAVTDRERAVTDRQRDREREVTDRQTDRAQRQKDRQRDRESVQCPPLRFSALTDPSALRSYGGLLASKNIVYLVIAARRWM